MKLMKKLIRPAFLAAVVLVFGAFTVGCSPSEGEAEATETMEHDMQADTEHEMEHEMEEETEHDLEHEHGGRIPNDGAVIHIVSPADGAVFASGVDILIEVEIENFELNVDGSHWHVYVDGTSYGMVVGGVTQQVLRNLEPGDHEVSAYLSLGTHEELEDGSNIHITISE